MSYIIEQTGELVTIELKRMLELFGGLIVILTAIFTFIAKILFEKIKKSVKHSYDVKTEEIKSELSKNNKLLDNAQSIFLNNIKSISSRKIEILENVWKNTLKIKKQIPPEIILTTWILQDKEFNIETLKKMKPLLEDSSYFDKIKKLYIGQIYLKIGHSEFEDVEDGRSFISEELFNLYKVYYSFIGRTVHAICWQTATEQLVSWKKDDFTITLLKSVLNEKEMNYIEQVQMGSFNQAIELLELKILNNVKEELLGTSENIDSIRYLMNIEKEMKSKFENSAPNKDFEIIASLRKNNAT